MSTLQVNTIQTNIPSGVLAVRDFNNALTGIQPSALIGLAVNTAPVFNDSTGDQIGTLCRAWVKITGTATPAIAGGFNVSSITDLAVGSWRVNFTKPMPSGVFVGFVTFDGNWNLTGGITAQTVNDATIYSKNGSAGAGYDPGALYVAFFA